MEKCRKKPDVGAWLYDVEEENVWVWAKHVIGNAAWKMPVACKIDPRNIPLLFLPSYHVQIRQIGRPKSEGD